MFSSMLTACTTTMLDRICQVLCRPRFSLDTWLASVMDSSLCLGQWVSVPRFSLFDIYTGQSSASRGCSFFSINFITERMNGMELLIVGFRIHPVGTLY